MISRRGLIAGLGTLLAAPAIVKATNIMAIKPWHEEALFKAYEHIHPSSFGLPSKWVDIRGLPVIGGPTRVYHWDYWMAGDDRIAPSVRATDTDRLVFDTSPLAGDCNYVGVL